jgi:hypothetical protein
MGARDVGKRDVGGRAVGGRDVGENTELEDPRTTRELDSTLHLYHSSLTMLPMSTKAPRRCVPIEGLLQREGLAAPHQDA